MTSDQDKQHSEQAFLDKARQELDSSCEGLDGQTLSRLNRIRHEALERDSHPGRALLAPFGGLVTACVLVMLVSVYYPGQNTYTTVPVQESASAVEDLDILISPESIDFFENLEFYQWLEENESAV